MFCEQANVLKKKWKPTNCVNFQSLINSGRMEDK